MKEIKVGQVWRSQYGTKNSKVTILITEKLNTHCWDVQEEPSTSKRMMTSDEIVKDYVLVNKNAR